MSWAGLERQATVLDEARRERRPEPSAAPVFSRDPQVRRRRRPAEPRVSVVMPALNEARNLPFVLDRMPDDIHELILVDGRSSDGTRALAKRLRPDVVVITQDGRGKGAALRSGFRACSGDIVVMLDADGSTDPAEIPLFTGALRAGADMAKGSRFIQGGGTADMPRHRKLGNRGLVWLVRLLFGSHYSDLCYGYVAFWVDVLDDLGIAADGFEVEAEINVRALRAGLRVAEVPSFEHRRKYGEGHLKAVPDGWRVLKKIVGERIDRGPRRRSRSRRDRFALDA